MMVGLSAKTIEEAYDVQTAQDAAYKYQDHLFFQ
jgi:hypothetical protein